MDRGVELNRAPSDCFSLAMGSSIDSSSQLNFLQNLQALLAPSDPCVAGGHLDEGSIVGARKVD